MEVGELIEESLYLSIKDKSYNRLPTDPAEKTTYLEGFLPLLNIVLSAEGKKNPAYSVKSVVSSSLIFDTDLNVNYIDLTNIPFLTIFRLELVYSGGSCSLPIERVGMEDFFSNANIRSLSTFPVYFTYNVFLKKIFIYPKSNVSGVYNIFGKESLGNYTDITESFPDLCSETFLYFLRYLLAEAICAENNAPWQAQKESFLKRLTKLVDSENNINYQRHSTQSAAHLLPMRNTRIGF